MVKYADYIKVVHTDTDELSKWRWQPANHYTGCSCWVDVRDEFGGVYLSWTPLCCRYLTAMDTDKPNYYEVSCMTYNRVWYLLSQIT